jgi:hypothetical protein
MSDYLTYQRYAAARHVLASPSIAARTRRHVRDARIDWHGLAADCPTMSGGERFLVDIARRLWSGGPVPAAYELGGRLDAGNAERVAEAVAYLDESQRPGFAVAA